MGNKPVDPKDKGIYRLWQDVRGKATPPEQTVAGIVKTEFGNDPKFRNLNPDQKTKMFSALAAAAGQPLNKLQSQQEQFDDSVDKWTEAQQLRQAVLAKGVEGALGYDDKSVA